MNAQPQPAQPFTVQFGPWAPDLQNVAVQMPMQWTAQELPCADCLNVYYVNGTYRSFPTPAAVAGSPTLGAQCVGAMTFIDSTGSPIPIVGTLAGAAYYWAGTAWDAIGLSYATAGQWNFVQFGTQIIGQVVPSFVADSGLQVVNLYTLGPGAGASSISGSPTGQVLAVVGQFIMVGDIYGPTASVNIGTGDGSLQNFAGTLANIPAFGGSVDILLGSVSVATDDGTGLIRGTGVTGTVNYDSGAVSVAFTTAPGSGVMVNAASANAYRARVQWSAIGNAQSWPTPLTDAAIAAQSGYQDNEYQYGPVMFIAGYPLYAVIFQRNAITRASYVGGQVVFSFATYAYNQGLIARGAAVQVGPYTYFLSDSGFFMTDGGNVTPIGTASDNSAGIDQWFWSNVNTAALTAIKAGYDARARCVFFAIPTGGNTLPDTLLIYNVIAGRWTRASASTEFIWIDSDGRTDRLGVFSQAHTYSLLTGAPNTGYLETCDVFFTDGQIRYCVGARPNINCTDSPLTTIGNRNTLSAAVAYSAATAVDSFSKIAPFLTEGVYTRGRVSSAAATAYHGATLYLQPGGPM